jgi:hypothetical protein
MIINRTNRTAAYWAGYRDGRDGRDSAELRPSGSSRTVSDYWDGYDDGMSAPRHNPNAEPLLRHPAH